MKITTTAGQLADLLGRVARAVSARSPSAILQGVLFAAQKAEGDAPGSLTLAATDTEISITLAASAPVKDSGTAVIPAKVLLQYVRSLPREADVVLEASAKENCATLSSGKSSVTLRCYPPNDFPTAPSFPEDGAFAVPAEKLAAAIAKVLPFVSKDESRPVLTGVLVEFEEGSARLAATDSYRLGLARAELAGAKATSSSAIVPARALKEAARLANLGTETVEVSLTQNACAFSVGGGALLLTTRLLDGNYPEYRRLLPDAFEHIFRAEREPLQAALNRVTLLAGEKPPTPVTVSFSREEHTPGEGELHVSLRNIDAGGAAAEVVSAGVPEGTHFSTSFNPSFLADAVASVEGEALEFCFNGSSKPAVVRAHDANRGAPKSEGLQPGENDRTGGENPSGHLCVIMPMREPAQEKKP